MSEIFTFAPTDRELAQQKQRKQTAKQRTKEFTRQYKISLHSATMGKQTTGGHLVNFKKTVKVCELYDQPVPEDLRLVIGAYEKAEAEHIRQAQWEEENPLVRYPRPYRETIIIRDGNKKSKKKPIQPLLLEVSG